MAVHLTRIYTRTGDDGTTGLSDFSRVSKNDARLEAYADCDETNAAHRRRRGSRRIPTSGFARSCGRSRTTSSTPAPTSRRRSSRTPSTRRCGSPRHYIDRLEQWCDEFNEPLPALNSFILPGGTALSALLHVARTVARRAERSAWRAVEQHGDAVSVLPAKYLNRLSDLLFILSRVANPDGDVLWKPGGRPVSSSPARTRRRPRLQPRRERRQCAAIEGDLVAVTAVRTGVTQFQHDDLVRS